MIAVLLQDIASDWMRWLFVMIPIIGAIASVVWAWRWRYRESILPIACAALFLWGEMARSIWLLHEAYTLCAPYESAITLTRSFCLLTLDDRIVAVHAEDISLTHAGQPGHARIGWVMRKP